jgi:hypothetical protein
MPRPARHVHLYLAAVDGHIVSPIIASQTNCSRAGCMRTGTPALPSDNLGRRTSLANPDTGKTVTGYDTASNVTSKITANLAAAGKAVTYDYDYNRLKAIHYPDSHGNDVAYEYGAADLRNNLNQIGRITKVSDASGSEERAYGNLGETVKEVRTIASHTQGNSANSPEVYTTQYQYDTFGRILSLTLLLRGVDVACANTAPVVPPARVLAQSPSSTASVQA